MPLAALVALGYFSTLILAVYLINKTIYIAHRKQLFDEPGDERKIHKSKIPNLGGIAIFGSLLLTSSLLIPLNSVNDLSKLVAATIVLFSMGLIDDLVGMDPLKKFITQVAVALFVCSLTDYRVYSFYGVFGIETIPFLVSVLFSALFLILTINAINLCDGINGLAGSITLLCAIFFSCVFYQSGSLGFLTVAVALAGAMTAFLIFNLTPARIFMGDTGAVFIGFLLGMFSLEYLQLTPVHAPGFLINPGFAPVYICAILIIPFYDTIRVFTVRIIQKKSPFVADRSHIHHRLIDLNLSHGAAVLLLLGVTAGGILLAATLEPEGLKLAISSLFAYILVLDRILVFISRRHLQFLIRPGAAEPSYRFSGSKSFGRRKTIRKKHYEFPGLSQ